MWLMYYNSIIFLRKDLKTEQNIYFLRETDPSDARVGARRERLAGSVNVLGNWKIVDIAAGSRSPNLGERALIHRRI